MKKCALSWLFTKIIPGYTVNKTQNSNFQIYLCDSAYRHKENRSKNVKCFVKAILFYQYSVVKVKVKVKFTLEEATKSQRGSRALLFL